MNIANLSPPVNGRERAGEPTKGEASLNTLLAHVRALRNEVERLRDELDEPEADLLSVEETATRLNVSERTIRSFVSDETLRSTKIGRRRLIPRDAVDEFIRSRVEAGEGRSNG